MDSIRNVNAQIESRFPAKIADAGTQAEAAAVPADSVTTGETKEKRGLVLLQIDGLSHKALNYAMEKGITPNISKLMDAKGYALSPYQCGIATVTLPVLASLFYGTEMPGNDWYDKTTGEKVDGSVYETKMREELAQKGEKGILTNGVVFSSPLSGGSSDTFLTVNTLKGNKEKKGVFRTLLEEAKRDIGMLKRGGYSLTKTAWNTIKDVFKARSMMQAAGVSNTKLDKCAPLLMACGHNIFEAVTCQGMKEAINKGVPVMYTDFAAYDEKAHYFGAFSPESMDMLKSIDDKIGQIVEAAEKSPEKYEVLVFSDHGQTPSKLFEKVFGEKVGDVVQEYAREARGMKDLGSREAAVLDKDEIVFTDAYSLGNLYFNFTKGHADLSAVEERYPGMTGRLAQHPGIGLVCAKEGDSYVFKGKEGTVEIDGSGAVTVSGKNPLDEYGDQKVLINQITSYMNVKGAGDVVIFGRYDKEKDTVIDFNKKYSLNSLHGGLGGDQCDPFIISNPDLPINGHDITEASQLHDIHEKYKEYLKG